MLPNKKNAIKNIFLDFGRFLTKEQPKKKNKKNPNRLMKFSEIWYVDASQQRKCYEKTFFGFPPFFSRFLTKKQPKEKIAKIQTI